MVKQVTRCRPRLVLAGRLLLAMAVFGVVWGWGLHRASPAVAGPGEAVRLTLALPRPLKEGVYHCGKLVVQRSGGVGYVWAPVGMLRPGQVGEVTFTNLPPGAPFACSFCEWDPAAKGPRLGDARLLLAEVVREPGRVRVRGYQNHGTLRCAVGLIVADSPP
jgi:hypothetical protein